MFKSSDNLAFLKKISSEIRLDFFLENVWLGSRHTREDKDRCEILWLRGSRKTVGKRKWTDNVYSWARAHSLKTRIVGFPGGAVVKNPRANAGDVGSSPGPGRCHRATKPVRHNY